LSANDNRTKAFSSHASGNLAFGLETSGQKELEISRADWSEISSKGSAGGKSIDFGCL